MAALPVITVPLIESKKSPEPYRSIEKALTIAIDRALVECEERSKALQSVKICTQQLAPCRMLTDIGQVTCITSYRNKEGTLVLFGTETGKLLALFPLEDENATLRCIAESNGDECDQRILALSCASSTNDVVLVASLLPSKLELRRIVLTGEEPVVTMLAQATMEKEVGISPDAGSTIHIRPSFDFIVVEGLGPELLLFEFPLSLHEALKEDGMAESEPLLLPSVLSITEATSRSFLQDPGRIGKTVFEFIRDGQYLSGNALRKPKEGGHRAYIWWVGSNRLGLFDVVRKEASAGETGASSEMHVCGDWILPDDITCSNVSEDGDWIAFGMENGKVLVWDVAKGNNKMLSCSIGSIVVGVKVQTYDGRPCVATVGAEGQFLLTDIHRSTIVISKYIHLDIVEVHWVGLGDGETVPVLRCRDGEWAVFDDARDLTQLERHYELTDLDTGSDHRLFSASKTSGWIFLGMAKQKYANEVCNSTNSPELADGEDPMNTDQRSGEESRDNSIESPVILAYDLSVASTIRWPTKPQRGCREESASKETGRSSDFCNFMNRAQADAVAAAKQRMLQSRDHDPKHAMAVLQTRLARESAGVAHLC